MNSGSPDAKITLAVHVRALKPPAPSKKLAKLDSKEKGEEKKPDDVPEPKRDAEVKIPGPKKDDAETKISEAAKNVEIKQEIQKAEPSVDEMVKDTIKPTLLGGAVAGKDQADMDELLNPLQQLRQRPGATGSAEKRGKIKITLKYDQVGCKSRLIMHTS